MFKRVIRTVTIWLIQKYRGTKRIIRGFIQSFLFESMGKRCQLCDGIRIFGHENIILGNNVFVNEGAILQSCGGARITIGDNVVLSYGVKLITGGLVIGKAFVEIDEHLSRPIFIEDGVWIGAGSIVLPGVSVGRGAIVAAGSVVTHDVASETIVAGSPAEVIRKLGGDNVGR